MPDDKQGGKQAQPKPEAKPERRAPQASQPVKGGRYIVGGKLVDANGKPIKVDS